MEFKTRKWPVTSASELRVCPIEDMKPHVLMWAPVYVHLPRNEKFLAVKAPMDFFSPEELSRLAPYQSLFTGPSVDLSLRFREVGRRVLGLMMWDSLGEPPGIAILPPAPYEYSDAVLRMVGPLWSGTGIVESFFVVALVEGLFGSLPAELLAEAREQGPAVFERALCRSSWVVFLAMILGQIDLDHLLRAWIGAFNLSLSAGRRSPLPGDTRDLYYLVAELGVEDGFSPVAGKTFGKREDALSRKIASRLIRIRWWLTDPNFTQPSVRGPGGFADAA